MCLYSDVIKMVSVTLLYLLMTQFSLALAYSYNTTLVQLGAEETGSKCWQYKRQNGGLIFSHAGLNGYTDNTDCKVTITTDPGKRIYLRFESFDIAESINCGRDEVIVYDGRRYASLKLSGAPYGLCGSGVEDRFREMHSTGSEVTVRFITDGIRSTNKGFVIVFASFDPASNQGADCFSCEDGSMCIDSGLVCDQLWHCKDGSDEQYNLCYADPTEEPTKPGSTWLTWMGTFFAIIVAAIITLFVILSMIACCCCRDKTTDAVRADPNYLGRMAPGCNSSDEMDSGESSCSSQDSIELGRASSSTFTGSSDPAGSSGAGSTRLLYGYAPKPLQHPGHHPTSQRHNVNMYSFNPPEYTQSPCDRRLRDCYSNDRTAVAYHSGHVALPPEIECR